MSFVGPLRVRILRRRLQYLEERIVQVTAALKQIVDALLPTRLPLPTLHQHIWNVWGY